MVAKAVNTEVTYLYRDYSNYKIVNSVVIPGHILPEQIQTILDSKCAANAGSVR